MFRTTSIMVLNVQGIYYTRRMFSDRTNLYLHRSVPVLLFLLRPNSWTKSSQKLQSFPSCFSKSPLQLCLEISISSNSRNLLQFLQFVTYTVKEKGGKPDRKTQPLPRNTYRNLKSDSSQDCAQKPQLYVLYDMISLQTSQARRAASRLNWYFCGEGCFVYAWGARCSEHRCQKLMHRPSFGIFPSWRSGGKTMQATRKQKHVLQLQQLFHRPFPYSISVQSLLVTSLDPISLLCISIL